MGKNEYLINTMGNKFLCRAYTMTGTGSISKWFTILFIGILLVAIIGGIALSFINTPPLQKPTPNVTITVPSPPVPVMSNGTITLGYELETSQFADLGLVLTRVEVQDKETNKVLMDIQGDMLTQLYQPASDSSRTPEDLQAGTGNLTDPRISILFQTSPEMIPKKIVHQLTFSWNQTGVAPVVITGGEITVSSDHQTPDTSPSPYSSEISMTTTAL
ncbi:hypothetical protein [Methanosphaerula subterraneus]|uniref:hypothetical protein n=1 Tax=Methanosphaerula subterraneus TaxID=3350244 RepID=UPI003F83EE57